MAGDAALFFDPHDVRAIANVLRRLLSDAELRRTLRQRGLEQAATFSWDRVAAETQAVYDTALSLA